MVLVYTLFLSSRFSLACFSWNNRKEIITIFVCRQDPFVTQDRRFENNVFYYKEDTPIGMTVFLLIYVCVLW